ncbi:MarR family winged helix-turn-helix transcriptional regulator [Maridesulfovibrio ferrireducens]|uniref:MarR family winged helix-turn-helix transcriptional regulator n=1 Tax=Maridesulfovibrio ferrireducens TaxID=246191 RepID=UPI001A26BAFE|nr:MarR family transcriptional regulator [Maridesulfovibrio ferrireducens]MBI9111099.1 MarR family transcriptional regulator [Maridesulfovibrio ferrireducens]
MKKYASFGYMNAQMVRLHKAILADKLSAIGITYGQIGFIMQALRNPGRNQDELSHVLSVDKAATARALAKLVKLGFLIREENPENRREKLVYPTEKAEEIKEDLHQALQAANELMMSGLDESEKVFLMKMLKRMIDTGRESLGMSSVWDIL